MNDFIFYSVLIASAFAAGAVNTLAGGGTLLTFPMLMSFGNLGSVLANGTSTVALVPGSVAGAWGYRKELGEASRWLKWLLPVCIVGGATGTLLVTELPTKVFDALIPWLILTASMLFIVQPVLAKWLAPGEKPPSATTLAVLIGVQFLVAVYGGYFGAGIGILMLSSLGFLGIRDIHRLNALKTILAAAINGVAVVVFVSQGKVEWHLAWPMAIGAIAGGYSAALVGRRLPRPVVRWFVIAVGLGLSAYYFAKQARWVG